MARLLCVRHGVTDWNAQNRMQGQSDLALNELGQRQAQALSRRLAREKIDVIFASDLLRARQTAEIVAAGLDAQAGPLSIQVETRLREISFGDWEGLTFAEIEARDPQAAAAWQADFLQFPPPNGETLAQLVERVESFLALLNQESANKTILLVAHGGPLQVLVCLALGVSAQKFWQFHLSPASVSVVNLYPPGAMLNLLNDTGHLKRLH